jgi:hypothetical protein
VAALSAPALLLAAALGTLTSSAAQAAGPNVLRVGSWKGISGRYKTIQAAVDAARPGDWILVGPGDYHESPGSEDGVLITTPGLHLRGMDRNAVIVDGTRPGAAPCSSSPADQNLGPLDESGQAGGRDGIVVSKASGVYVENLTACNFLATVGEHGNEIWWNGGDGSGVIGMHTYWGNYLTASSTYSNGTDFPRGEYAIFVSNADGPGSINDSYASNMGDAAFYVGACPDCNSVLNRDHAQYSALGYSGTNSGGHMMIRNSEFDNNKSGIVSNSQNNDDAPGPQIGLCPKGIGPTGSSSCTVYENNSVHDNNNPNVPGAGSGLAGSAPVGSGIVLAGTEYITLYQNQIVHNGSWGVLVADLPDQEEPPPISNCEGGIYLVPGELCYYQAFGNEVSANSFSDNGFFGNPTNGDIGLATQVHAPGNCFHDNSDPDGLTSDPPNIQSPPYNPCGLPNGGDMGPLAAEALCATELVAPCPDLPEASYPRPTQVVLPPIPVLQGMADPCAGVPTNPWCPKKSGGTAALAGATAGGQASATLPEAFLLAAGPRLRSALAV